jgi:hypothetical protein
MSITEIETARGERMENTTPLLHLSFVRLRSAGDNMKDSILGLRKNNNKSCRFGQDGGSPDSAR